MHKRTYEEAFVVEKEEKSYKPKMEKLEYLYGVKQATWKNLNYMDAFILKNTLANKVLSDINNQPHYVRDDNRKMAVLKAIRFNKERMME